MTDLELLDHPLISERYFFPRHESPESPHWIECDGARLACAWRPTQGPAKGTIVHFHGNGEVVADWLDGFDDFCHHCGWNLLLAEYRGYGGSSGRPQLGQMLNDAPKVVAALDTPPEKVVLFGRSVGSLFALEALDQYPGISGLVLESGVADVRERLLLRVSPRELGVSPEEFDHVISVAFDHQRKLSTYRGKTLVLHAAQDDLVDVSHGHRLHAWAGGPKELKILPRGGHNDIMYANSAAYFAALESFLDMLPPDATRASTDHD